MVKGNNQTTNDAATEIREMRALIERPFGEVNARLDKFDQTILELKEQIESSRAQEKGGKGVESAMSLSAAGNGNPSTLQEKENVKGSGKTLTTAGPNEKRNKKHVSLIEDESEDVVDMAISMDAVVTYANPYEGGSCVTGYHGKRPLTVLMGMGGTSHNFINESLADKLGCDTVPIKPRNVRSAFGKMVTSRACNNFQLSLQGTKFSLKMYLLPLSSNCDMVLGGAWIGILEKLIYRSEGVEFYFQGKKQFVPFKESAGDSKR